MYYILRPRQPIEEIWREPTRSIYGQRDDSVAFQVQTLAQLHKEGSLSDKEYLRLKEKAMA